MFGKKKEKLNEKKFRGIHQREIMDRAASVLDLNFDADNGALNNTP
jgi:hypothetical protein